PLFAQAQSLSTAKVSKGDAQKVVTIISSDKVKTQAYCDIQKLAEQMAEAHEKKDSKTVIGLFQKIETLEKTLGPEYAALIDGVQDIVENDQLRAEFLSAFGALARLCTGQVSRTRRHQPPARLPAKATSAATGAMPTAERLWTDDRDDLQDRWNPSIQLDKEHAIAVRKPDAPVHDPAQHNNLVPERSIFGFKSALRLEWRDR